MRRICIEFCLSLALIGSSTLLWPSISTAQGGAPEEIRRAQSLVQTQDYDGAIKILEDYFQRNPSANIGWLLLGSAYRQKGDLEKALGATLKATQSRPTRAQALYNAACIYALK